MVTKIHQNTIEKNGTLDWRSNGSIVFGQTIYIVRQTGKEVEYEGVSLQNIVRLKMVRKQNKTLNNENKKKWMKMFGNKCPKTKKKNDEPE